MTDRDDAERQRLFVELKTTGSPEARDRLVESYRPLAEFFARRYRDRGVESADLSQVANLALVKAVDGFDLDFGTEFSTYAGRTIDGELKRHFRDKTWAVRVPRSLKERSLEVRRAVEQLTTELDRSPTVDEIAVHMELPAEDVIEALDAGSAYRASSLDQPAPGSDDSDSGGSGFDRHLPHRDPGFQRAEMAVVVSRLLSEVDDREKAILEMRFYQDMSQAEIADELGISQMHVSRLLRRTLEQLREAADG